MASLASGWSGGPRKRAMWMSRDRDGRRAMRLSLLIVVLVMIVCWALSRPSEPLLYLPPFPAAAMAVTKDPDGADDLPATRPAPTSAPSSAPADEITLKTR